MRPSAGRIRGRLSHNPGVDGTPSIPEADSEEAATCVYLAYTGNFLGRLFLTVPRVFLNWLFRNQPHAPVVDERNRSHPFRVFLSLHSSASVAFLCSDRA